MLLAAFKAAAPPAEGYAALTAATLMGTGAVVNAAALVSAAERQA